MARSDATLSADPATAATFLPKGKPPRSWARSSRIRGWRGRSKSIAKEGRDAFYKGSIARAIVADIKRATACSTCATSPSTTPTGWSRSATNYRGYDVLEMPPSTQGFVALEMLNIMEGFDISGARPQQRDYLHVVVEAKRIAFADRGAFLADRDHMPKACCKR